MNRVNKILKHKRYREYVRRNEKEEQNRQFCKHGMTHFLDVARIAWHLNVEENAGIDKELIYAAALLHDIGRHLQYTDGIPHEQAGVLLAPPILAECGFEREGTICTWRSIGRTCSIRTEFPTNRPAFFWRRPF